MPVDEKQFPRRKGRPPGKPSVESRVIEACAEYWVARNSKHAAHKGIRVPEAGTVDLLLLGPSEGTLVVVARSWPHAAAFAHIVGQAIGEVAHLLHGASANVRDFVDTADLTPSEARKLNERLVSDAGADRLGVVFAIGFTDQDGDEPVRKRLLPVAMLLDRWAEQGAKGLRMGVHVWSVRLGDADDDTKVEPMQLRPSRPRRAT